MILCTSPRLAETGPRSPAGSSFLFLQGSLGKEHLIYHAINQSTLQSSHSQEPRWQVASWQFRILETSKVRELTNPVSNKSVSSCRDVSYSKRYSSPDM